MLLNMCGHIELARFVKKGLFVTGLVNCLPACYTEDIVFELPPIQDDAKKRNRVQCIEQAKDCYYWIGITPTSALLPTKDRKKLWYIGKMVCTGAF
jgi:hypothetical protein